MCMCVNMCVGVLVGGYKCMGIDGCVHVCVGEYVCVLISVH